jgi:F420-0:gamma-glutamyl ligase-like protein
MQNANVGKALIIEANGGRYKRIPVRTHIITEKDKLEDILVKYVKPVLEDGDIVFMSEKAVACTQKRAIPMKEIKPRPLATFLSRFVYKTPYGIGLGIPETMEMALRECGTIRILFAAFI